MKFLAVTACPSGVAHTYMAAEAIQQACEKAGVECKVETQGSIGSKYKSFFREIQSFLLRSGPKAAISVPFGSRGSGGIRPESP